MSLFYFLNTFCFLWYFLHFFTFKTFCFLSWRILAILHFGLLPQHRGTVMFLRNVCSVELKYQCTIIRVDVKDKPEKYRELC